MRGCARNIQAASGQRHPIASRSRSWDVFVYDLFPNQLRPTGLFLEQLRIIHNNMTNRIALLASPVETGEGDHAKRGGRGAAIYFTKRGPQ